ncbi:TraR/DksA family transcriptional regulator [Endozoicomonadaceae bacterium StTr2]
MSRFDKFQQILTSRRTELETRLGKITRDVSKKASADWSEQAQERENDEVLDALGNETELELRQVVKALDRLSEGDYGICERCGVDIPEARLEIMPYAALCVKCANEAS